jgi:uncharacterized protein (DUF849 family)
VYDAAGVVAEAVACIDAGAGIVHFHHDARLDAEAAVAEIVDVCHAVQAVHPDALLYPGILAGATPSEHVAHLVPLADAGVLGFAPVDPGAAVPYGLEGGLPSGHGYVWNPVRLSNRIAAAMRERGVPLTIGVYEPVQLRWALASEAAGALAPGSMVKLYFGGDRSLSTIGERALNFGLPPTPAALDVYLAMLEGSSLGWNVGVMGGSLLDLPLARHALDRGGDLRVGIEDGALDDGPTNVELVRAAVALAAGVGRS